MYFDSFSSLVCSENNWWRNAAKKQSSSTRSLSRTVTRCEWSPSKRQLWVLYQILGNRVQHLFLEVLQCVGDENLAKDQLEKDENWQSRVL